MKSNKTSQPKIKKKQAKDSAPVENLSIIELARLEKNMGHNEYVNGKPSTRQLFELWLTLPSQFKGAPDRIKTLLGIDDEVTLELLLYPTMQAFAQEFGVQAPTLSRWRKEIEASSEFRIDVKRQMQKLTHNVMGALYRKVIEEGDAPRVMAWMKIVEDWREQLGIEHSGEIGSGLTEEEKAALDALLAKNATP